MSSRSASKRSKTPTSSDSPEILQLVAKIGERLIAVERRISQLESQTLQTTALANDLAQEVGSLKTYIQETVTAVWSNEQELQNNFMTLLNILDPETFPLEEPNENQEGRPEEVPVSEV